MSVAMVPGSEFIKLPPLDPQRARALFPILIERLMKMDLPEEQVTDLFRTLMEPLLNLLSQPEPDQAVGDSWKQWFDFCESLRTVAPVRSYQDILDDPDRR